MKKILFIAIISLAVIGCDEDQWLKVEKGAEKAAGLAKQGEQVAVSTSFLTGPYGEAAVPILGALSAIATAVAGLARKKTKKIAKAASEAAELTSGGGKALVMSSLKNGVIADVKKAYDEAKKTGG